MEDTRLDLDAPLLSARRFSTVQSPAAPSPSSPFPPRRPPPSRTALPLYKPDQKSGPVRIPGSVPFLWEHSPGRPKPGPTGPGSTGPGPTPVRPPPRTGHSVRTRIRPVVDGSDPEEAALSRTDSLLVNCSLSGIADYADRPGLLYADAPACDFIMRRFLPAAQALAGAPPRPHNHEVVARASACEREPPIEPAPVRRLVPHRDPVRRRAPVLRPHGRNYAEEEEEEYYYDHSTREFSTSRVCGLIPIFCLNNSFCLLNLKLGGRSSRLDEYENSWEAVDYKQKLEQRNQKRGSQLGTESNWIMDWTSSQMSDWAFPFPHQTFAEAPALEFHGVKKGPVDLKESSAGKDHIHKVEGNSGGAESRGSDELQQHKSSDVGEHGLRIFPSNENAKHDASEDSSTTLPCKLQLLLPKSPSDSWLSRVLPSASPKKLPARSFLVLRSPPTKQASRALADPKPDLYSIAEVLVRPASQDPEI